MQCHGNHNGGVVFTSCRSLQVALSKLAKFASLRNCASDVLLCAETGIFFTAVYMYHKVIYVDRFISAG